MRVLFLGEGEATGPARYLAAVLTHARLRFDRVKDGQSIPRSWVKRRYDAFLLSDFRHSSLSAARERWLVQQVREGAGILMVGGWASFTGLVGHFGGSAVEKLLPIRCLPGDDRVNRACLMQPSASAPQPEFSNKSFWQNPPMICGYNRVELKKNAIEVVAFRDLQFRKGKPVLGSRHPGLVIGQAGKGRTATFLSDCAPHWAGSLVDWGSKRVTVNLAGNVEVEVGETYLEFFGGLVRWVAGGHPTGPGVKTAW